MDVHPHQDVVGGKPSHVAFSDAHRAMAEDGTSLRPTSSLPSETERCKGRRPPSRRRSTPNQSEPNRKEKRKKGSARACGGVGRRRRPKARIIPLDQVPVLHRNLGFGRLEPLSTVGGKTTPTTGYCENRTRDLSQIRPNVSPPPSNTSRTVPTSHVTQCVR